MSEYDEHWIDRDFAEGVVFTALCLVMVFAGAWGGIALRNGDIAAGLGLLLIVVGASVPAIMLLQDGDDA